MIRLRRRTLFISLAVVAATAAFTRTSQVRLTVTSERVGQLRQLRGEPKFLDLPGTPADEERRRFKPLLNALLDRLIEGIEQHPDRAWVLVQMDPFVGEFYLEDTELRESCLAYIGRIFAILGIPDDDGAFRKFMIFW